MYGHHPSEAEFALHGLTNVLLDPSFPASSSSTASFVTPNDNNSLEDWSWTSGWATLSPVSDFPLIEPASTGQVHFYVCPHDNAASSAQFRWRAQLLALDVLTLQCPIPHPEHPAKIQGHDRPHFSRIRRIVAWWQDDHGLWLITDEDREERVPLREWWQRTVAQSQSVPIARIPHGVTRMSDDANHQEERNGIRVTSTYIEACEALLAVVERLQALQTRDLALVSCQPCNFSLSVHSHSPVAHVERFRDVSALPGFGLSQTCLQHHLQSSARLFGTEFLDFTPSRLPDTFIRENLQYLAPEVADSRRPSRLGDIFSFGALAYELLTGITIDGRPQRTSADADMDLLSQIHRQATLTVPSPVECWQRTVSRSVHSECPPRQLSEIVMRCLEKDPEERYSSFNSLAYDLRKFAQICRVGGDLAKFVVGEVDVMSRFVFPKKPVHRDSELKELDHALTALRQTPEIRSTKSGMDHLFTYIRVVNVWGLSGSGKSQLVYYWARNLEMASHENNCLVGWAKLDEQNQKPLSSFVQVFQSLLGRVLTDPREDAKVWNRKIREILGLQFPFFVSLLSSEFRAMISLDSDAKVAESIDWQNFISAFQLWSKQLLQLFATRDRPLVLVVDDIHWMPQEEVKIWRYLLDGLNAVDHVLVVSLYRVNADIPPPSVSLLSASSTLLRIAPLDDEGVDRLIGACLRPRVDDITVLTSLLSCETAGNPLYLRTILADLVQEGVLYFDFDILSWRYDLLQVQSRLSDSGVDAYIKYTLTRLSPEVRETLAILSTLPVTGFRIDLFAAILNSTTTEVRERLNVAREAGNFVEMNAAMVKFSHDRFRMAAYNLIPSTQLPELHHRVSVYLRRSDLYDDFVFEAADHALVAQSVGQLHLDSDDEFVTLLLDAASKSALSASFAAAKSYLDAVQVLIDTTGGVTRWCKLYRSLYLRFLTTLSDVSGILKLHEVAFVKLDEMALLCETDVERVQVATLRIKQKMSANNHSDAMDMLWETLRDQGYDPACPKDITIWTPSSVEEVHNMSLVDEAGSEDNVEVLLMNVLAYAGPTIFVARPGDRAEAFALGMTLIAKMGRIYDSTSYLLSAHAITIDNVAVIEALCARAKQLCDLRPDSFLTSSTLVVIGYLAHYWQPLEGVLVHMSAAFDATTSLGNYEVAAYVWLLDLAARVFSRQVLDWEILTKRYNAMRQLAPTTSTLLIHAPLQWAENILQYPARQGQPWDMLGSFITPEDLENGGSLLMHIGTWYSYALRLALFYNAPREKQESLMVAGNKFAMSLVGTIVGIEWSFLTLIVLIRGGKDDDAAKVHYESLQRYSQCPDFAVRVEFIAALRELEKNGLKALSHVEKTLAAFDQVKHYSLSGLLNYYVADSVIKETGSTKLAAGFLRDAYDAYKLDHATGLCQWMTMSHPTICPTTVPEKVLPSQLFNVTSQGPRKAPVILRRVSTSASNETSVVFRASTGSAPNHHDVSMGDGQLDTLTLMTSSLSLASEQDPSVLLCTLLRILCQYTMSDFAAIGLNDPHDRTALRIRAAGPSGHIVPHDLSISEAADLEICPATFMLHVARTGQEITTSMLSTLRPEPFYGSKHPRSIIALPVLNQGNQVGVILLSSMSNLSTSAQSSSARGVVGCLATFASIAIFNNFFTKRLKQEVEERTRDLTSALAAKTQFLSQCSHELRTPLSSILGLAAVLQVTTDLSDVQLEHVQTIISSGEDLLGLINNILDHSRIESGSVTPERISFSLRHVVEDAVEALAAVGWSKEIDLYLTSSFSADPPGLIGDPFRIKQILLNLVSNAIKFTRKGRVTITWRYEQLREDEVKVWVEVEDTGIGIPAHKMDKLFRSFSQVDESITRNFGGSGLGLVISKDLARLLGGDCSAVSELGKGSKFTFSFVAAVTVPKEVLYTPFSKPQSCLVICQTELWQLTLERNLADLGCRPWKHIHDVEEYVGKSSSDELDTNASYDHVLVDLELMTTTTHSKLRSMQPEAKFVYLVRNLDMNTAMEKYRITRDEIVTLPIRFASLYNALSSVQDKEIPKRGPTSTKTNKITKINREMSKTLPLDILLVDDNLLNLKVGKRVLAMFGYKDVATASDGRMAIEAAEKRRYDLILLDLQMPILDGFTAHERIKASPLAGHPCVVALTANVDQDTQSRCQLAGFFDYLSKPLIIPSLEKTLVAAYKFRQNELNRQMATVKLEGDV